MEAVNTLPRYFLVRVYLSLSVVIFTATSLYQSDTHIYRLIAISGGEIPVFCLMLLAALAALDALVNDLLPVDWRLDFALRHRHVIYMLIAIGTFSMAYTLWSIAGRPSGASLHLLLSAMAATLVAFLDLFARRHHL